MNIVLAIFWTYAYFESPLLIWLMYPAYRRFTWLGSPKLVFPTVAAMSVFLAVTHDQPHMLAAGLMVAISYYLLAFKLGYPRLESVVMSVLMVLAIDQLWQLPLDFVHWQTLQGAEVGLVTGGLSWTSLPILFYFLGNVRGKIRASQVSLLLLIVVVALMLNPYADPYWLIVPWFLFFLSVFAASAPLKGPLEALRA